MYEDARTRKHKKKEIYMKRDSLVAISNNWFCFSVEELCVWRGCLRMFSPCDTSLPCRCYHYVGHMVAGDDVSYLAVIGNHDSEDSF
jgi:hypothetical protein